MPTSGRGLDTHVWISETANNDLAYVQRFGALRAAQNRREAPLSRSAAVDLAITEYAAVLRREIRERPELFLSTRSQR